MTQTGDPREVVATVPTEAPTKPPPSPTSSDEEGVPPTSLLDPWNPSPDHPEPQSDRMLRIAVDAAVVTVCMLFVFLQLGPSNVLSDTTPAGGDMGAHVWGPAYLRDNLLTSFQLTGWTNDWYAGFPAYQFYMVLPPLAIVLLDLGFGGFWIVLPVVAAAAAVVGVVRFWSQPGYRALCLAGVALALLCISLPYGVAFKLVSVSGPIALPLCAYAFGRLAGLRFPTPSLLAVATLPFLFNRGYSIWGGNLSSMLAGEFAFSIALCLGLLYLGVVLRGVETGRHRALAAGLLALTALCHLIPFFWVSGATLVVIAVRFRRSTAPALPCVGVGVFGLLVAGIGYLVGGVVVDVGIIWLPLTVVGVLLAWEGLWLASETTRWLTPVIGAGGLLASFWLLPAAVRRPYMNDFGWEKIPYFERGETWGDYLLPSDGPVNGVTSFDSDLRWAFVLAFVGLGLSIALRLRAGIFLGVLALVNAAAAWGIPEGQLWNARLLPFYYLAVFLLAGLAVGEVVRLVAALVRPGQLVRAPVGAGTAVASALAVIVLVGLPLGALPWDEATIDENAAENGYEWPSWSPWTVQSQPQSYVNGWANWNYTGYEGKDKYREYYDIVTTMKALGEDPEHGCGRAFWEYEQQRLDGYGTPMALMLLPYWTDGCIDSMEGLYFESSMTTPYHFLMASELSAAPSNPQRDLPYGTIDADFDRGVKHMQMLGVRYYMAFSDKALSYARAHPDLTEIASSGPWAVFEVANSDLVVGLSYEPAVLSDIGPGIEDWLHEPRNTAGQFMSPSVSWFIDQSQWEVMVTADGPDSWQRVEVSDGPVEAPGDSYTQPERRETEVAQVSNIVQGDASISFDVDRVGSPVLVKASYFPNWSVDGAEGPYRVAPNLMVVVPTERHVELHSGRTIVEWGAYTLTFLGVVLLVVLIRQGTYHFKSRVGPARSNGAGNAAA